METFPDIISVPLNTIETETSPNIDPTATEILADAAKLAARLSVDASVTAKNVIATAATVALKERERQDDERSKMKDILVDALNKVFGEKKQEEQFINVAKIPLICLQIQEIHKSLGEIAIGMESLKIVKKIVFGLAALMMTGVVVALINMIIRK